MSIKWSNTVIFTNKGGADQNAQAQEQFYSTLTSNYNSMFSNYTSSLDFMQGQLKPIIQAGPGQFGFSGGETAALRSGATQTTAAEYGQAAKAVGEKMATAGGGNTYVPSGAATQVQASLASAGAGQEAGAQNQITEAGYQQGQQNYWSALGGYAGVMPNPNSFGSTAVGGGQAASSAIQTEIQADQGWMGALGGALGGAGSALGGYLSK